jgi:hypothetical protein
MTIPTTLLSLFTYLICFFLAFLARELIGDEYVKKIPLLLEKEINKHPRQISYRLETA